MQWSKKIMLCSLLFCIFCALPLRAADPNRPDQGVVVTILMLENPKPDAGSTFARIGYKYGVLEGFGGVETEYADLYEFGFLIHSRDIVEPNAVKVISPILLGIFTEDIKVTGYTGLHWVKDRVIKEEYSGAIVGLEGKQEDSPLSIRAEVHYDNNESEDITFYAGLAWKF